ncbi:MAG: hypothetical protein DHS20C08_07330 [Rhodomicrobium sp.]|nr:MAG: hypothetical protein DHS20C08_07330 [Rhodomicrobium sp.]
MLVFLTLIGFLVAILYSQAKTAFMANPALNGMILAVLFIGILFSFGQIFRLYPEIRWINKFRFADPSSTRGAKPPKMLASMANMLRNLSGPLNLSTNATSAILDSVGSRLDEARETSRYLVGLLIFLGLLGTFWGLLETIGSVGKTISSLDTSGSSNVAVFTALKEGLQAPLQGMGTAFSSSLFGLAGSLILGFMDLQAGQAQNRFYHETEEWLASMTVVNAENPDSLREESNGANLELTQTLAAIAQRLEHSGGGMVSQSGVNVADSLESLVTQMRAEQKIVRQWIDEQANQNAEMRHLMAELLKTRGR